MRSIAVFVKGPGAGRESALRALQTSGFKVHLERPHHELGPWPISTASRTRLRLFVGIEGDAGLLRRLRQDARPKLARRREHAHVPNPMEPRGRHRRAEPREERERIEIHREGPVGDRFFSATRTRPSGASTCRGVQREAAAPDGEVPVEVPLVGESWRRSSLPPGARRRRHPGRRVRGELGERAGLVVLRRGESLSLGVVGVVEQPAPLEVARDAPRGILEDAAAVLGLEPW